ncbi:loganic acid O-methyltransferase-like isoform X2 [Tripterygium wilfordii]|uniref:loganic acid O-methyltransferase-like isoform X2 n=1 Tax=Tripterygium wilfordii TaxID=458696 RepID=UPI0018F8017F|nr:loganic acid O-methyltransferase-like isoform X2 [Tripterygium wilfordii]
MAREATKSTTMNGGDGEYSYFQNSSFQRSQMESVKLLIKEGIDEKFDNIIDSMKLKYQSHYGLEFQVLFNDFISNDFNTLFKNLPLNRQYLAAAVPGTFHGRLVPKNSLHFVHSSFSLHWLSHAPEELVDESSPAYNKGRIFYTGAPVEVLEAYLAQFAMDMTSFLDARSLELVHGGLMTLILPCIPDGIPRAQSDFLICNDLLESSLIDLTKEGSVSEGKLDSFNLPIYNPTVQEFKALIESNPCFSIERMASLILDEEEFNVQTVRWFHSPELFGKDFSVTTLVMTSLMSCLIGTPKKLTLSSIQDHQYMICFWFLSF